MTIPNGDLELGGERASPDDKHVTWQKGTVEPAESLSLRREALHRLEFVSTGNPTVGSSGTWLTIPPRKARQRPAGDKKDLPQTEISLRRCLSWSRFLPANCLRGLQQRLYQIHVGSQFCSSNPWQPLVPPIIIDVTNLFHTMGQEYRWWHVRFNYVLSFSSKYMNADDCQGRANHQKNSTYPLNLNLRDFMETLIELKGPHEIVQTTTFDMSLLNQSVVPVSLLRPDVIPFPYSNESEKFFIGLLWPGAAHLPHFSKRVQVPLIRIIERNVWQECLAALGRSNSHNELVRELVDQAIQYF